MTTVMLDAGHGGKDPGACFGNRREKDDVLRLTLEIGRILSKSGIKVLYTRTSDIYESPSQKANKGRASNVDFFLSLHRNAASATAKGYETLVLANTGRAAIFASLVNKEMQAQGFVNRGTKIRNDLAVLTSNKCALAEVGFLTNAADNQLFDSKFGAISSGLAKSVTGALGILNTTVPVHHTSIPDVKYQAFTSRWYPNVINTSDYAGVKGVPITCIYANTVGTQLIAGNLKYRVHVRGGNWLPWVIDRNDYAGNKGKAIDGVQMVLINLPNRKVQYRVSAINREYYPWVTNTENEGGYAGVYGKSIDRIQIKII